MHNILCELIIRPALLLYSILNTIKLTGINHTLNHLVQEMCSVKAETRNTEWVMRTLSPVCLDSNIHIMASGNSLMDTRIKGIFDTGDGHQCHATGGSSCGASSMEWKWVPAGGPTLKTPAAEHNGPQHLIHMEDNGPWNVVPGNLVNCLCLDARVGMLSMVQILGNNNVTRTLLHEDLQWTLEEWVVTARLETDKNTHGSTS